MDASQAPNRWETACPTAQVRNSASGRWPPFGPPPHLIVISGSYHVLVVLTYIHSGPYLAGPDLFFQIRLLKSSKGIEH